MDKELRRMRRRNFKREEIEDDEEDAKGEGETGGGELY